MESNQQLCLFYFQYRDYQTGSITKVEPQSGLPGEMMIFRLFDYFSLGFFKRQITAKTSYISHKIL